MQTVTLAHIIFSAIRYLTLISLKSLILWLPYILPRAFEIALGLLFGNILCLWGWGYGLFIVGKDIGYYTKMLLKEKGVYYD